MKDIKFYILIICLAISLAGCGLKLKNNENREVVVPESTKALIIDDNNNDSQTFVDYLEWKEYIDEEHSFKVDIPIKDVNVHIQAYTLDEVKDVYNKKMEDYLAEGGMAPYPLFPEINYGSDVDMWIFGKSIYDNKDNYKNDNVGSRCKKDETKFDSCFILNFEGISVSYEKIIYNEDSRISISIDFPTDRFFDILRKYNTNKNSQKRFKKVSELLDSYINKDFTKEEKEYFDVMDKIVKNFGFTK